MFKILAGIQKFLPQNFNDLLALGAMLAIPVLWLVQAIWKISLPNEVNGALIVTFTLIVQYYFRKSPTA